jgi:hypothetical protein
MAEIKTQEVHYTELKPDDVVRSVVGTSVIIAARPGMPEPDRNLIHRVSTYHPVYGGALVKENGVGYWHMYRLEQESGLRWDQFKEKFGLTGDEYALRPVATKSKEA